MALKEYQVDIGGLPHTLQLSDADAKRYEGAELVKERTAAAATTRSPRGRSKSKTPANKQAAPAADKTPEDTPPAGAEQE